MSLAIYLFIDFELAWMAGFFREIPYKIRTPRLFILRDRGYEPAV